ncbi:serine/threoninepakD-likeprotein and mab-3-related transcription factor 2-like [Octopus vulgaris]|uniref:Serine/threoninepakD-likeprotein and mab-3-related transcription factor 2-like n=1 Tax=Octopus vulgaris TaxID=6645 RepID=A0AA36BTI0_OCTVU|nr:serine/threoninepakD-likeprotein and mab-3-related transcription factor 2-like [Octopus vulgaris]
MAPKRKELSEDLKKIIFNLHKNCLGYKLISKRMHISVNTVAKVIQKYKATRRLNNRDRPGRRSILTARDIPHIQHCEMDDRRRTASSLAQEVSSVNGKSYRSRLQCLPSPESIRGVLPYMNERMRKRRCFADKELEVVMYQREQEAEIVAKSKSNKDPDGLEQRKSGKSYSGCVHTSTEISSKVNDGVPGKNVEHSGTSRMSPGESVSPTCQTPLALVTTIGKNGLSNMRKLITTEELLKRRSAFQCLVRPLNRPKAADINDSYAEGATINSFKMESQTERTFTTERAKIPLKFSVAALIGK